MNDDQSQPLPEWIATLIGRLVLENEAMRRALAAQATAESEREAKSKDQE